MDFQPLDNVILQSDEVFLHIIQQVQAFGINPGGKDGRIGIFGADLANGQAAGGDERTTDELAARLAANMSGGGDGAIIAVFPDDNITTSGDLSLLNETDVNITLSVNARFFTGDAALNDNIGLA